MAKTLTAPPLPEFPVATNGAYQTDPQWEPAWEATPEPMPHPLSSLPLLPPHAPEPTPEVLLSERALCLALSLSKPGNHRKLSASLVEVDADKELISAQKKLLSSEHLKTIGTTTAKFGGSSTTPACLRSSRRASTSFPSSSLRR